MSVNYYNKDTGELVPVANGTLYADAPIGSIIPYGGTTAPSGWLPCQGQAVSRTEYAELFAAIGTAFGEGDGSTTFNVPDLREAVPVGTGTRENDTSRHDIYDIGTFKDDRYASHNHTINHGHSATSTMTYKGSGSSGGSATVSYSVLQNTNGSNPVTTNSIGSTYNITTTVNNYTGSSGNSGDGTVTHGKQLGVNYIIKAKQVAMPTDFMDAIDDTLSEFAKPISLQSTNNSTINCDRSRVVGGLVTVCADIIVQSGTYLTKENAIARVPNYGTDTIAYILPCINRNTGNGAEEPGYVLVNPNGNVFPYYTKSEYNQVRVNASYSSYN